MALGLVLAAAGVNLLVQRVDPHGTGAYQLGKEGAPLSLKLVEQKKIDNIGNPQFRYKFGLPAAQDRRVGAPHAPRYPDLGEPVFLRGDGRGVTVVYDKESQVPAIDLYDTHHAYKVIYQVVRSIDGKEPPKDRPEWVVDVEGLFPGVLEMLDFEYQDGRLYLSIGINGYAKILKGETAYVACIDPATAKLVWRTGPLVSNGPMLPLGKHIITGYGFTAEKDALYVLDAGNGATVQKIDVPSAMSDLAEKDGKLLVETYGQFLTYEIKGLTR
ncbi:MAG: hypothetical protein U0166_10090 [Acidobacteriota bacterium]